MTTIECRIETLVSNQNHSDVNFGRIKDLNEFLNSIFAFLSMKQRKSNDTKIDDVLTSCACWAHAYPCHREEVTKNKTKARTQWK